MGMSTEQQERGKAKDALRLRRWLPPELHGSFIRTARNQKTASIPPTLPPKSFPKSSAHLASPDRPGNCCNHAIPDLVFTRQVPHVVIVFTSLPGLWTIVAQYGPSDRRGRWQPQCPLARWTSP